MNSDSAFLSSDSTAVFNDVRTQTHHILKHICIHLFTSPPHRSTTLCPRFRRRLTRKVFQPPRGPPFPLSSTAKLYSPCTKAWCTVRSSRVLFFKTLTFLPPSRAEPKIIKWACGGASAVFERGHVLKVRGGLYWPNVLRTTVVASY